MVYIHGGGYGTGNGQQDFTDLMKQNGKSFVVVGIQYRLGPFGYLSSDEVVKNGVANAGLLDQFFALQWVQTYISQFGGDPSAVTISGESAGADEGPLFTPQNITSEALLLDRLREILPEFSADDLANVLLHYPVTYNTTGVKFATTGTSGPSALDQSGLATGQQQRANNIYAELTFVCPSYWMAEAFSGKGRSSYKYQYSAAPGTHGIDTLGYFGPYGSVSFLSEGFQAAFMNIWGNFVTQENPSIPESLLVETSNSSTRSGVDILSEWPQFSASASYQQLNLNQTGGVLTEGSVEVASPVNTTYLIGPGLQNNFAFVDAYTWEAGRGARCEFWRSMAKLIPA
ncbi:hypothetical protein SLS61_009984 [Didymella pomorum]